MYLQQFAIVLLTFESSVCYHIIFIYVILLLAGGNGELVVSLDMPRFASRGSSVTLVCNYNYQAADVHKVEWHKSHGKLAQYIKGRKPLFITKHTPGATHNVSFIIIHGPNKLC